MPYTIPPDTRAVGTGNPPLDIDNIADVLTGMGAAYNVLNTAYAGGADPTGAADSAPAFQACINALPAGGGLVTAPAFIPGTATPAVYKFNSAVTPVSGLHLTSGSYMAAKITSAVSSLFIMDPGTQLDVVEIDHLSLEVTGAFPIFSKMWITRSSVHHCYLQAHNAGASIWFSNTGTGYMAECRFYENREQVWGATRTVPAWYLNANNTGTLFQVNDNHWRDIVCFDNDKDSTQWWYQLIYSGAFAGVTNNANTFTDIVFEFPCGGIVRLESCSYTTLERLTTEDFASSPVGNQQISVVKNASGGASQNTTIRDYTRRGGAVAITDIQLDANCIGTEIDSPALTGASGGSVLTIDLGSSVGNTLTAIPSTAILNNATAATFTDINRQLINPSMLMQPTGTLGASLPDRGMGTQNFTPTTALGYVVLLPLVAGVPVTNLVFMVNTTAEAGGTHGFYSLLDINRKVLANTADQTGATFWSPVNTEIPLALAGGPFFPTYSGNHYAMVSVNATTMPSFVVGATMAVNVASLAPILCGSIAGPFTTPPTVGTTLGGITVIGNARLQCRAT